MKVQIDARHFDLTDAIREHIDNKSEYLKTQIIDAIEAHYILNIEEHTKADGHIAELNLHIPGETVNAKIGTDDLYKSIDQVTQKVVKIIHKHKEKSQSK
jgi:putative sigma-54 modulation protein